MPWIGSLAIQLVAAALGIAGIAVTASATASPWLLLSTGFAVYAGVVLGLTYLAVRNRRANRKRGWLLATGALVLLALFGFSLSVLIPVDDLQETAAPVEDMGWWHLSDGSRIAYSHTPPTVDAGRDPIVFLHGGPGIADLAGDTRFFGQFSEDGHDVYVYDQVGTGHSSRLDDPAGYTLDRWADDLEEIRSLIDRDRVILVAHSWGARIALRYLDQHPERVSRLVLSSPGAIPGSDDQSGDRLADTLPRAADERVRSLVTQPRMLASYGLLQINPEASLRFTPDPEIDARMDRVYNASRPALHCPGQDLGPELHGLGFYAHQFPLSAKSPPDPDIRNSITGNPVPTLVIKGECDYLTWSSAIENTEALPNSTLVYLEDAGHNVYQDRPDAFLAATRAFLVGEESIPDERDSTDMPESYQGPP